MYGFFPDGLGTLNYPTIDAAIQKFEGYAPGTLAYQNNNPGNLVYASWESKYGCTSGGAGGFAKCPTYEAGQEMQDALVTTYASQGLSLSDMLAKWSPPAASGNSQTSYDNYVASVAADTGLDPSAPISQQTGTSSTAATADTTTVVSDDNLASLLDTTSGTNWTLIGAAAAGAVALLYALR